MPEPAPQQPRPLTPVKETTPAAAADAVHRGVGTGVAVARQLHDDAPGQAVRAAFVHGMDLALIAAAGVVLAGAVFAALFLPRRARRRTPRGSAGGGAASRPALGITKAGRSRLTPSGDSLAANISGDRRKVIINLMTRGAPRCVRPPGSFAVCR